MVHPEVQTTRRSAGLPLCLTALIATHPESTGRQQLVNLAMPTLLNCLQSLDLSQSVVASHQVHALNVLRALFKHAQLAEAVSAWLGVAFEACFRVFASASWPIRNGALMLLAALLNRAFGSKSEREDGSEGNRVDIRLMLKRLPIDVLIRRQTALVGHHDDDEGEDPTFTIFPLLSVLQRLAIPRSSLTDPQIHGLVTESIHPLLSRLLAHRQIKVRRMAARIMVAAHLQPLEPKQKTLNWIDGKQYFDELRSNSVNKPAHLADLNLGVRDPTSPAFSIEGLSQEELHRLASLHYRHEELMSRLLPILEGDLRLLLERMTEEQEGEGIRLIAVRCKGAEYPQLWHRWIWDDDEEVRREAGRLISQHLGLAEMSVSGCVRTMHERGLWKSPDCQIMPTLEEKDLSVLFEREPLNQFIDLDWESRL